MENPTLLELPTQVREIAERNLGQARAVVNGGLQILQRSLSAMPMLGGAELSAKMLGYTEQNVFSAFEFLEDLIEVKDIPEALELQTEFVKSQMQILTEQASDLGQVAMKTVPNVTGTGKMDSLST